MEFCIVAEVHLNDMEEAVNKKLEEGWLLRGELVLHDTEHQAFWYQAMFRQTAESV